MTAEELATKQDWDNRAKAAYSEYLTRFIRQWKPEDTEENPHLSYDFERDLHYLIATTVANAQEPLIKMTQKIACAIPSSLFIPDKTK